MKRGIIALTVAGIWIALLCTAPQMLGLYLAAWLEVPDDLPLEHLLKVALNSLAVLVFILVTGRAALLAPRWPAQPRFLLLLVPLVSVNLLFRGSLIELTAILLLVLTVSTFLTGFWEEFLFRGLIQERLAVLGPRVSMGVTAVMFSLVHANKGPWPVAFSFAFGLVASPLRDRVGIWTLVLAHWWIDITSDVFRHPGWEYIRVATPVFLIAGLALLARAPAAAATGDGPEKSRAFPGS